MNVIFLDIDGVLNYAGCKYKIGGIYFVDDEKIKLLKELIDNTDAKVVLSSTWRFGWEDLELGLETNNKNDFVMLRDKLLEYDITLYDKTPRSASRYRGEEIGMWLKDRNDIDNILILDDDTDMNPYKRYFLQTSFSEGLHQGHVRKGTKILKENTYKEWNEKRKEKEAIKENLER